jgi:hypothetical protein
VQPGLRAKEVVDRTVRTTAVHYHARLCGGMFRCTTVLVHGP